MTYEMQNSLRNFNFFSYFALKILLWLPLEIILFIKSCTLNGQKSVFKMFEFPSKIITLLRNLTLRVSRPRPNCLNLAGGNLCSLWAKFPRIISCQGAGIVEWSWHNQAARPMLGNRRQLHIIAQIKDKHWRLV